MLCGHPALHPKPARHVYWLRRIDFGRSHRGAGDVTTLVRQDACIGDDGYIYINAKKIERKKEKLKVKKEKKRKRKKGGKADASAVSNDLRRVKN
jgi:hypothetical protein